MKKIFYILATLAFGMSFYACEDINDKHDIYMQGGETLHVGKMDSLYLYPGYERALLKCWISDRRSTWIVAQKNDGEEQWISIPEMDRKEAIEVYIDGLVEGSNKIRLYTANQDKTVTSIPATHSVTVYGEQYVNSLVQRTAENAQSCEGFLSISWGPKTSEQLIGEKVYYTDKDGNKRTYIADVNTKVSVIKEVFEPGSFEYASLYKPVATAIDTFEVYNKTKVDYESTNISEELENLGMRPATEVAKSMTLGWNLGNTMEVGSGETAWGNPLTTMELIKAVKDAGFTAVRIPCIWGAYAIEGDKNYKIKPDRMARVKEVVNYCYDNGLYVFLNTHHDWLDKLFNEAGAYTPENIEIAKDKIDKIWGQIATEFRDYDDKLLFGFLNEANISQQQMPVYKEMAQQFVDLVRNSGGKNLGRTLVIQAPNTDINRACSFMEFPIDKVPNRMMTEVHYYAPWAFCGTGKDKGTYFWGEPYLQYGKHDNYGQEDYVHEMFKKMKDNFVDSGIPVILGEYGAIYGGGKYQGKTPLEDPTLQALFEESRAYYYEYVAKTAKQYGLVPFVWDDGYMFPLMDRGECKVIDMLQNNMDALNKAKEEGVYPY